MGMNSSSLGKLPAHTTQKVGSAVIWNATQHAATADQIEQGVKNLEGEALEVLRELLTFEELPSADSLNIRGESIVSLLQQEGASPGDRVMIGGAPFFMEPLCHSLRDWGMTPVFAFSRRESVEQIQHDGSVRKVAVFRHIGFVHP